MVGLADVNRLSYIEEAAEIEMILKLKTSKCKIDDTWVINLRKFSSKFLRLCVNVMLLGYCSSTHKPP